jgi:hypothetical protein
MQEHFCQANDQPATRFTCPLIDSNTECSAECTHSLHHQFQHQAPNYMLCYAFRKRK